MSLWTADAVRTARPEDAVVRPRDLVTGLADLVLGARCPGCGRPAPAACEQCVAGVVAVRPFPVPGLPSGLPPVLAGGWYDGELRQLVLAAKEREALGVVGLLGGRVAAAVAAWLLATGHGGPVVLVPVPSSRAGVAARGLDLPWALAGVAATRLRATGAAASRWRGLRLVRAPRDQSELGRGERLANLAGALRGVARPPDGVPVVVDDIVTTGATLAEAVRAGSVAGWVPGAAAVVAATPLRGGAR